jgi:hypothetical protein
MTDPYPAAIFTGAPATDDRWRLWCAVAGPAARVRLAPPHDQWRRPDDMESHWALPYADRIICGIILARPVPPEYIVGGNMPPQVAETLSRAAAAID